MHNQGTTGLAANLSMRGPTFALRTQYISLDNMRVWRRSMHVARSWYPGSCEGPEYVPFPIIVAVELDGVLLSSRCVG